MEFERIQEPTVFARVIFMCISVKGMPGRMTWSRDLALQLNAVPVPKA
jgi:hypothetical protein